MPTTDTCVTNYAAIAGPGRLLIRTSERKRIPRGHVVVHVRWSGLCSSDLGAIRDPANPPGARLGHEVAGLVSDGRDLIEPGYYAVQTTCGLSDRVFARPADLVPVPAGLDPPVAALAEPVACALLAVERSVQVEPPSHARILGAGFMGLVVARLLVARGVYVSVVDPDPEALVRAAEMGVEKALRPDEVEGTAALVLECVGSPESLIAAVEQVGVRGTLSVIGYHQSGGGKRTVDMRTLNFGGIDIINAHERDAATIGAGMSRALRLMARGIVPAAGLVTGTVELDDLPDLVADPNLKGKYLVAFQ